MSEKSQIILEIQDNLDMMSRNMNTPQFGGSPMINKIFRDLKMSERLADLKENCKRPTNPLIDNVRHVVVPN